jgi:hypothetical protein
MDNGDAAWHASTLCTIRISLSTSTERLLACTMRLYSGFMCAGNDMASAVLGFASYFSISYTLGPQSLKGPHGHG